PCATPAAIPAPRKCVAATSWSATSSSGALRPLEPGDERIRHALDVPHDPCHEAPQQAHDDDSGDEADADAGEHIAGIVRTDEQPADTDDRSDDEKHGAGNGVERKDRERD